MERSSDFSKVSLSSCETIFRQDHLFPPRVGTRQNAHGPERCHECIHFGQTIKIRIGLQSVMMSFV